jgi:sugar-specific transcriptional regulator TrmB
VLASAATAAGAKNENPEDRRGRRLSRASDRKHGHRCIARQTPCVPPWKSTDAPSSTAVMKRTTTASSNAFRALGLAPAEERVYCLLLPRGGTAVTEISKRLKLSLRASQRVLGSLESKGLVTHSPEEVHRYSAVPPDIAADVLIARRQSELHQARAAMVKLRETIEGERKPGRDDERFVEILSRQTAAQMFLHSVATAQSEILGFERMPMLVSTLDKLDDGFLACLARGVRCRAITDNELLNLPGTLKRLRMATAAGEQFRLFPSLPFKLVVFDRRIAIIPLHLARQDGPVLLVRPSSLLDALCEMFEMYWRAAAPFVVGDSITADTHPLHADPLIPLLASGMNDKSIEHELGMSSRTLARRIVELTGRLGASTRFQAGWLAARALPPQHDGDT